MRAPRDSDRFVAHVSLRKPRVSRPPTPVPGRPIAARRPIPANLLAAIEAMGIRATEAFWAVIPPEVARRVRPHVERIGDGLLTLCANSDALRLNRVIGLGHRARASEELVDRIVERFRSHRLKRFSVMLSPGPQSAEIAQWLGERGFLRHAGYALLVRGTRRPVPVTRTDLRVAKAARRDAGTIVAIHEQCFGGTPSRKPWALAGAFLPGLEQYLARAGRVPVAVGTLRIEGELAWLGGGATLTPWRRHGAHAALIAARLRRAARARCRWVWVETSEPLPGRPAGSNRNLVRLGFEPACIKSAFVWHAR